MWVTMEVAFLYESTGTRPHELALHPSSGGKEISSLRGAAARVERTRAAEGIPFPEYDRASRRQRTRSWKKVSGNVQKIIKDAYNYRADVVEINIPQADDLSGRSGSKTRSPTLMD